tara:strand:+ start:1277 stop:1606 length:330 start_codon:yes stop_codon:yes gene_type:complete
MNPGKMNIKVSILEPAVRIDASGGALTEWHDNGFIWAAREVYTQRLASLSQIQVTAGEQSFVSHYTTLLTTACRVMIADKQFRVVSATEAETPLPRTLLRFTVKEGEAE